MGKKSGLKSDITCALFRRTVWVHPQAPINATATAAWIILDIRFFKVKPGIFKIDLYNDIG